MIDLPVNIDGPEIEPARQHHRSDLACRSCPGRRFVEIASQAEP